VDCKLLFRFGAQVYMHLASAFGSATIAAPVRQRRCILTCSQQHLLQYVATRLLHAAESGAGQLPAPQQAVTSSTESTAKASQDLAAAVPLTPVAAAAVPSAPELARRVAGRRQGWGVGSWFHSALRAALWRGSTCFAFAVWCRCLLTSLSSVC
jgi:hypothetical protein